MRKMKKFAAIMLLTAVASLSAPQAFAGGIETPGLKATGGIETPGLEATGGIETPGLEATGGIETPGLTAALTFLAGFLG